MMCGLEIHVQLETESKLFCDCPTNYKEAPANSNICPVCLNQPGAKPYPTNEKAIENALMISLMLNCKIDKGFTYFMRKHYDYPDLPSGYQRTSVPIGYEGELNGVRIREIHMEEDPGQYKPDRGTVDFNRSGIPLIEIVTEPDIKSPEEARTFLKELIRVLQYSGGARGEGTMRADVNISIEGGNRVEMKNINSFKNLEDAINYEIERQTEVLEDGGHIIQETRTFDPARGITLSMRSKENAHDYRYMPEPDLPPIVTSDETIAKYKSELPELPDARRARLESEYGLSEYDAGIITSSRAMAEYFDAVVAEGADAKLAANWIMGDLAKNLNEAELDISKSPVEAKRLGQMIKLIMKDTISGKIAKKVFKEMWTNTDAPEKIVKDKGLVQITDTKAIEGIVDEVIAKNQKAVDDYKGGNKKAIGALVGQVMKASKGKANPQMVNKMLAEKLN